MLIRIDDDILREFPDDLAALIVADPTSTEKILEFSTYDINVLVHGIFGAFYDKSLSYEQNIEKMREKYSKYGQPDEDVYLAACKAVKAYITEVKNEDIGVADPSDVI